MCAHHPGVRREHPRHGTAVVPRGMLQPQEPSGRGQPLRALLQKRPAALGWPACPTLPRDALGAERPRANQGGPVARPGRRHLDRGALATPAALDVGGVGALRGRDQNDGDRPWRWPDAAGGDPGCHPGVCFSARGAWRGPVWAKRVAPQAPAGRGRRPVASRTASGWVAHEARRSWTVQPAAREPQGRGRWPKRGASGAVTCWPGVAGRPGWGGEGVRPGPRGETPGARGAGWARGGRAAGQAAGHSSPAQAGACRASARRGVAGDDGSVLPGRVPPGPGQAASWRLLSSRRRGMKPQPREKQSSASNDF